MKIMKIWSLAIMFIMALTSCDTSSNGNDNKPQPGPGDLADIVNEWALVSWSNTEPSFNVYIDFNSDGTFAMYQQIYTLDYVLYTGEYNVAGDILTGTYADGTNWQCGYKVSVATNANGVKEMTLKSQEDVSLTSIYEMTTIPEDIKAEVEKTRAEETVVRFL